MAVLAVWSTGRELTGQLLVGHEIVGAATNRPNHSPAGEKSVAWRCPRLKT